MRYAFRKSKRFILWVKNNFVIVLSNFNAPKYLLSVLFYNLSIQVHRANSVRFEASVFLLEHKIEHRSREIRLMVTLEKRASKLEVI